MFKVIFGAILAISLMAPANQVLANAYDTEAFTVASSVVNFDSAVYDKGDNNRPFKAIFIVETAQIRFTLDGTDPTTTVGLIAEVGDIVTITGEHDIQTFKAIRTGATSATLQPIYFNGLGDR